jgi:flagellar hook-associated protein 2
VLTGKETGADESFSITNSLTGSTLTFGANAVEATDATILVNNVQAISKTNTFDSAVPGVTLTVLKADPVETIGINVTSSPAALKTRLEAFVKSFNDVIGFFNDQQLSQQKGEAGSLARDPMARQIRTQLRSSLTAAYGTGDLERLSQIGVEFTLTGTLKLNSTTFEKALTDNADGVMALLSGDDGAFAGVVSTLEAYTNTDGLLKSSRDRLTVQIRAMDTQLFQAQDRLAVQRATLQQEFIAAEIAMSRLNAQSSALAGVGGS